MSLLRLLLILMLSASSGVLSGCDWFSRTVYLGPGQIAEVESNITIPIIVTDKVTGKRVRSKVKVPGSSGWFIGRSKIGAENGD